MATKKDFIVGYGIQVDQVAPSTNTLVVDSVNDRVGVGITSPATKLDVLGNIQSRQAATQDGIILSGRAGGTGSFGVTLTPTTLTANRTLTLPDATGTVVTYGTTPTNGQLLIGNGSGFTLSTLTAGSNITITNTAGAITIASTGGGLTHFVESEITSAPNVTVPVDALTATDAGYTDIDVAFVAKGAGATLVQIPDGTVTGGDKRGQYATDLQKSRSGSTAVASGNYSVVLGGFQNTASSTYSVVVGGQSNKAQTNLNATVAGGNANTASGESSSICGGYGNTASNSFGVVSGGYINTASGNGSAISGGFLNIANSQGSYISGGRNGTTRSIIGYHTFPACYAPVEDAIGRSQSGLLILGRQTTDATPTVITSNSSAAGTTNQVILPNNSAYFFKGSIIAGVTGGGNTSAWEFKGAIKRGANAAATSIVGSVILDRIAYDSGASAWSVSITADTTNGGLAVTVTGQATTTIRWVCKVETTEMTY